MINRSTVVLTLAVLIGTVSGAAAQNRATPQAPPVTADARAFDLPADSYLHRAFTEGEVLDLQLSWLRIVGGSGTMRIGPVGEDSFRMTSVAKSEGVLGRLYPIHDSLESTVDAETFSTTRYRKVLDERNRKKKEELTTIDPEEGIARRKGDEIPVPTPVFDPVSVIYYLRTLALDPGSQYTFSIIADGKVYDVKASVVKRETVETPAGWFRTVVVEPKMHRKGPADGDDKSMTLWFTDDERHLPVRIRSSFSAGSITASLRGYRIGGEEISPATGAVKSLQ